MRHAGGLYIPRRWGTPGFFTPRTNPARTPHAVIHSLYPELDPNYMNEDILHHVLAYEHPRTLVTLCSVSKSMRLAAARRLYRRVHIRSFRALEGFDSALKHDNWLATLVVHLIQGFPRADIPFSSDSAWTQWQGRFVQLTSDILSRIRSAQTVALNNASVLGTDSTGIIDLLAELPALQNVRLPWVNVSDLERLPASRPLKRIGILVRRKGGLSDWLSARAQTLRFLRIDQGSGQLCELVSQHPSVVFPHLVAITASPGDLVSVNEPCAQAFPALRVIYFSHPLLTDVTTCWPRLEHLDLYLCDTEYWGAPRLPPGHSVRSLRINPRVPGLVKPREVELFTAWASPDVRALSLGWNAEKAFDLHAIALGQYHGLRLLEVHIPENSTIGAWIQNVSALPARPALEALTLHTRTTPEGVGDEWSRTLLALFPRLRLARIFHQGTPHSIVWPTTLEWLNGCEIVAEYLPQWTDPELRAPWDDVSQI